MKYSVPLEGFMLEMAKKDIKWAADKAIDLAASDSSGSIFPYDSGRLARSVRARVSSNAIEFYVLESVEYAMYGRNPERIFRAINTFIREVFVNFAFQRYEKIEKRKQRERENLEQKRDRMITEGITEESVTEFFRYLRENNLIVDARVDERQAVRVTERNIRLKSGGMLPKTQYARVTFTNYYAASLSREDRNEYLSEVKVI